MASVIVDPTDPGGGTTAPDAPTGVSVEREFDGVRVYWTNPSNTDVDYIEVWRNTTNDRSTATKVGEAKASGWVDQTVTSGDFYYWVRARNTSSKTSAWYPTSSTGGMSVSHTHVITFDANAARPTFITNVNTSGGVNSSLSLRKDTLSTALTSGDSAGVLFQVDSNSTSINTISRIAAEYQSSGVHKVIIATSANGTDASPTYDDLITASTSSVSVGAPLALKSYAAASLPASGTGGQIVAVSDDSYSLRYWTGSAWASVSPGSIADTDDVPEGSTNLYFTQSRARTSISVTDSGGDGSLSYDNSTGVITYTGPSASEVRAHFTAGTGITITSGTIASSITQYTDSDARSAAVASSNDLSLSGGVVVVDGVQDSTRARGTLIATRNDSWTPVASVLNTVTGTNGLAIASSSGGANGYGAGVSMRQYSGDVTATTNSGPAVIIGHAGGTNSSPSATTSSHSLGNINFDGYATNNWASYLASQNSGGGTTAIVPLQIQGYARETFADNGSGTVTAAGAGFRVRGFDNATSMSTANRINFIDHTTDSATYRADTITFQQGSSGTTNHLTLSTTAATFVNAVTVSSSTSSTSSTTGALKVTGGISSQENIYAGGQIIAPNRTAFRVYGSNSTDITATTTITSTQGATVDYNTGSNYDNSTGIFTVPSGGAGIYQCWLTLRVGTNNALNQAVIVKNNSVTGANIIAFWETDTNAGTASHFTVSGCTKLAVGDTIRVKVITGKAQFDGNDSWGITFLG